MINTHNYIDEDISLQLVEVGICKQLLQIENQQQAMDILVLLLGKGSVAIATLYTTIIIFCYQTSV